MKQAIATVKTRLLRGTVFLALLSLIIPVIAVGQERAAHASRISNINGKAPEAARAGSPTAPMPLGAVCPSTITQSSSQSIVALNSVSCNDGFGSTQNSYWRAFNMATFTGGQAYDVTSVSFGIEEASSLSDTGQSLTVNLYTESGAAFPAGTRTLLATSGSVSVPDQAGTILSVPLVATVPAGTLELVMEVNSPDGTGVGNLFFIGSNPDPESGPSYLSAPDCGVNDPTTTAALGFPDMHIVFNVNGSCPAAGAVLTELSPARLWVGLKNSDDQGTQFDIKVEVLKNGTPVASGLQRCMTGLTRNPNLAKESNTAFDAFAPVTFGSGDVLSLRVSTRIGTNPNDTKCAGPGGSHNSATGLRLYYDAASRASHFDATISPNPNENLYLHSDGSTCPNGDGDSPNVTTRTLSDSAPGAANPRCKNSGSVNFAGGNPFSLVGTWSLPAFP